MHETGLSRVWLTLSQIEYSLWADSALQAFPSILLRFTFGEFPLLPRFKSDRLELGTQIGSDLVSNSVNALASSEAIDENRQK